MSVGPRDPEEIEKIINLGEGQWIVIKGRGSSGRTIKPELNDGIDYVIER